MADQRPDAASSSRAANAHVAEEILRRRAESLAQETADVEFGDLVGILLFRLADEWYGLRVEDVREIYQEFRVTQIPCVPDFVLGVMNIRGEIISVTDVAKLIHLGELGVELEDAPAIVVYNDASTTAIVIDEIGDIVDVPRGAIEPALSNMDKSQAEFVAGSIYLGDRIVGLINVDRVLEPVGAAAR